MTERKGVMECEVTRGSDVDKIFGGTVEVDCDGMTSSGDETNCDDGVGRDEIDCGTITGCEGIKDCGGAAGRESRDCGGSKGRKWEVG